MADSLFTSLSGILSANRRTQTTANNLSNLQTPGFREQRANTSTGPGGTGAQVDSVTENTTQGSLIPTGNSTDAAIAGRGFFQVTDGDGNTFFTRDGSFTPNEEGTLVNSQGMALQPEIQVPQNAEQVSIGEDGTVTAQLPDGETAELGQIELATFSNPQGLSQEGGNLASATGASGQPQTGAPGTGGRGFLQSGFLEGSNVDVTRQMVNLIADSNAVGSNTAAARARDEMTQSTLDMMG